MHSVCTKTCHKKKVGAFNVRRTAEKQALNKNQPKLMWSCSAYNSLTNRFFFASSHSGPSKRFEAAAVAAAGIKQIHIESGYTHTAFGWNGIHLFIVFLVKRIVAHGDSFVRTCSVFGAPFVCVRLAAVFRYSFYILIRSIFVSASLNISLTVNNVERRGKHQCDGYQRELGKCCTFVWNQETISWKNSSTSSMCGCDERAPALSHKHKRE